MDALPSSPAALRNRDPILQVLARHAPASGRVLMLAEGTGEHVVHFAAGLRGLTFQPTDLDAGTLEIIAARREAAALPNVLPPVRLDASDPASWPQGPFEAIVAINMIHISPWAATEGLMAGAGRCLAAAGVLLLYGPYREAEVPTAPSNEDFDEGLRSRNPAWGLRDRAEVEALAGDHGLRLVERVEMPANNLALVFARP